MFSRQFSLVTIVSCCCVVAAAAGCGTSGPAAVQPELARTTLTQVLDGWKAGQSPDAWRQQDPEIVVQDRDWTNGVELLGYEIVGPGEPRDANLYCEVKLKLKKGGQALVEESATYVVGTDPVLTVFRAL